MTNETECGGNNSPVTYGEQGMPQNPTPSKIDLRDAHAVRRELCSIYRDARNERITTQDATRLGYLLDLIRKGFETAALQDRIELLERTLNHRRN